MKNLAANGRKYVITRVIRDGLRMLIPVLMVGSAALILRSLPVDAYQAFIQSFASGLLYTVFSFIYNATFGMLSAYMVISLSYGTAQYLRGHTGTIIGTVSSGLVAFLVSVGFGTEAFELSSLSAVGMFTAILCGTTAPMLYLQLSIHIPAFRMFSDGSEPTFNRAVHSILPLAVVSGIFALFNFATDTIFHVNNFYELFSVAMNALFTRIGGKFWGAFLYIVLSSVMWFFGIHGSDVLESVNVAVFEPAAAQNAALAAKGLVPTEIYTKTFFDVFVLMGGCGCALALLVALFLFSRRRSSRTVAKMAAVPMLFNINEMMVFGLPITYNPILLVPFIAAPLSAFLISSAALSLGLVPLTTKAVEWTTPILLGGYQATGSYAGSVLQLVNLIVSVFIYVPFVKRYDQKKEAEAKENIDRLIRLQKENEAANRSVRLTDEKGLSGDVAKQLVHDLRTALDEKTLFTVYQPQCDEHGSCIGAEALLRYVHPVFGAIYPPLVIKLAEEGGMLSELEMYVFSCVKNDMEASGFDRRVSINVTSATLQMDAFCEFLKETFPNARAGNAPVCVEITEQRELVTNDTMIEKLSAMRDDGFSLAIDDFSMGFTSIKYLQDGKFDEVKLDGSLVSGMADSPRTLDIISSIIFLSASLHFSVLAEFVETVAEQQQLEKLGCRAYQGYLFSKPLPLSELTAFAAAHKSSGAPITD